MPVLANVDLETFKLPTSNYGYSAVRPDNLGATEYTLVTLAVDESGSVAGFVAELNKAIKEVIRSCKYSPRADNLLVRLVAFSSGMREVHGYKPLAECNEADYDNVVRCGGSTALYDSVQNAAEAAWNYADQLTKQDYLVNGILVVITDGEENCSSLTIKSVEDSIAKAVRGEHMESHVGILVGCNTSPTLNNYLTSFRDDAGFSQYVDIGSATSKSLAKLAQFVSKSITSQSQALGTGGPSKSLTF